MMVFGAIVEVTLRALLGRRRTILLVLLAALPVLVAVLARVGGGRLDEARIVDALVIRVVLPLTALVFGTSALGSELEDGTAVYLLAKPVPRWQVVLAKTFVAATLTAGLAVGSTLLTGMILSAGDPSALAATLALAVSVAVAAAAYVALFVAASVLTSRALVLGLIYTLVWEGVLAGILAGTRMFSIREATLAVAAALAPVGSGIQAGLDLTAAALIVGAAIGGGLIVASTRLARWEVRGTD